ncbi:MAG TPA: FAD-dependent thymidylate synthase, partial [bacterium]|nr:FAD-dependent thymidylate synthase [bacterium]
EPSTDNPADLMPEIAGRLCYLSYGKGRKENSDYLNNILSVKHGSVVEHTVFNFLFTGVSRSLTHELVRHRAGFGYSQLSQRYVDESACAFVEPRVVAEDPEAHRLFAEAVTAARDAYIALADRLEEVIRAKGLEGDMSKTRIRKLAREAARAVLPNATETKIFVTANGRALRHFLELRGSPDAEPEIRALAVQLCRLLQTEAPNLFADYELYPLPDCSEAVRTPNPKV